MKICGIILAAGNGARMNMDTNKVFMKFGGSSALIRSIRAFEQTGLFSQIIVATKGSEQRIAHSKVLRHTNVEVQFCEGGSERQYSVQNALALVDKDADIIAVHDAARCFVSSKVICDSVESAIECGSGVASIAATDTVKRQKDGIVEETLDRSKLVLIQTPQSFRAQLLMDAYAKAEQDGFLGTDDSSLVERLGVKVHLTEGSTQNIKITTRADAEKGKNIVDSGIRVGTGYDMHAFVGGRKLVLGGVTVLNDVGLDGHSDADVLTHAVMDALLGAAKLGDIGKLFPPSDEQYKDIYSLELLSRVGEVLAENGFYVENIDSTIVMQAPKVGAYIEQMEENIADALGIARECVSVKATTTEHLGAVGRREGAAAQAVCLIKKQ